jgi:hypothetical protein
MRSRRTDPERRHARAQVVKFSPEGKVLMTLGTPGEAGVVRLTSILPSDIAIASNGDVFIADGHADNGNNRVVKFSKDGKYIKEWGRTGWAPGEFHTLHALRSIREGACLSATAQ